MFVPNSRALLLIGVAVALLGVVAWKWVSGWGLISVDFHDAPLAKVIKAIENQGGVRIATNADPALLVAPHLERSPVYDALDTLSARIDGSVQLAFLAAPKSGQINDVLAAFRGGTNPGGWAVFSGGFGMRGGGGGGFGVGETEIDPRVIEWKVSETEDKSLQGILNQGSQKTGALFAVPQDWNPVLGKLPKNGRTGKVANAVVGTAGGKMEEYFLITVRPPRPAETTDEGRNWEFSRTVFSPQRGPRNPEWVAERVQAQIAALPPDQQADAKKQIDEMRTFWDSIRDLPEDQRRERVEAEMNKPEVQERMDERMAMRDGRRSPEQREQRMRRYVERKKQMKTAASQ